MNTHRSILATISTLACVATLTLSGCGGGGGSSTAAFCKNYPALGTVSGTDPATLTKAANLYRQLAGEAPTSVKGDLNLLADDELKVRDGGALSVDNSAAEAASHHADSVASSTCAGKS